MTALHQRMIEDMQLKGRPASTQKGYLNAVRGLAGLEVADIFRLHGAAYRFSQYGAIGSDRSADPWSLYIFPGIRYGRFQVAAVCGHVLSRIRGKI